MRPDRAFRRTQASAFDVLVGQWWEALRAAQAALLSARPCLGAQELSEHRRRLTQERGEVVRLLEQLGHEWQTDARLASTITQREIAPA